MHIEGMVNDISVEFPCGLKISQNVNFATQNMFEEVRELGCPLHGKDCRKNLEVTK